MWFKTRFGQANRIQSGIQPCGRGMIVRIVAVTMKRGWWLEGKSTRRISRLMRNSAQSKADADRKTRWIDLGLNRCNQRHVREGGNRSLAHLLDWRIKRQIETIRARSSRSCKIVIFVAVTFKPALRTIGSCTSRHYYLFNFRNPFSTFSKLFLPNY